MASIRNKILNFFNRSKPQDIYTYRRNFGYSGGTVVNEDTCMQASGFYRGVIYLSSQVAKLPIQIKNINNEAESFNETVTFLLNTAPNYETTSFHFKLFLIQCALINGNGYAEIERDFQGRPKNLWPLNPRRVTPKRTAAGDLVYEIFEGGQRGETIYLQPKDMFICRNLHTKDAINGLGVVGYMLDTLGISIGADRFANSLFANGGMPSGILKHPGTLSDEAYNRLKDSWSEDNGGRKSGSTAILEEGVEYSPISHSPDVMQFLETREFSILEIARFLGVPPSKLFDPKSKSYNSLEQENLSVISDTIDAWAVNFQSEVNVKLLYNRRQGYSCELDLYALSKGDMDTRSQYFSRMVQLGTYSPNEVLAKEGQPTYEGGDRKYIATNNLKPIDRLDEIIDSEIAQKTNPKDTSTNQPANDPNAALTQAAAEYLRNK